MGALKENKFTEARGTPLEFAISSLFQVHELPDEVRCKWASSAHTSPSKSLRASEDGAGSDAYPLEHKMGEEEEQKLAAQALEDRLSSAEAKRQNSIDERRRKAAKTVKAAESVRAQQEQLRQSKAARLEAKLEQAERLREQQHALNAQKLEDMLARVKNGTEALKQREAGRGLKRQADLMSRLQRAEDARYEKLQTVTSCLGMIGSGRFLVRKSVARGLLRRQASSRVIQRHWRRFVIKKRTTADLIACFESTGLLPGTESEISDASQEYNHGPSIAVVGSLSPVQRTPDPFDDLAAKMQSQSNIRTADRLLTRLAKKIPTSRRNSPRLRAALRQLKANPQCRYPTRVFSAAIPILSFPEVVFNVRGEQESNLSQAADAMMSAFQQLLASFQQPVQRHPRRMSTVGCPLQNEAPVRTYLGLPPLQRLLEFDAAWISYLEQFTAWKVNDVAVLEASLISAAVELEASKIQTLNRRPTRRPQSALDRQAVVEQTDHDHALLRERIFRMSGQAGLSRLEAGLAAVRAASNPSTPSQTPETSPLSSPQRPPLPRPAAAPQPASASPSRPTSASLHRNSTLNAESPQASPQAGSNEPLMWELLYNMNFKFPSEGANLAWTDAIGETNVMTEPVVENEGLKERAIRQTRIMEQAFYDHLRDPPAANVAGLLSELGQTLIDILPPRNPNIPRLQAELQQEKLQREISQGFIQNLLPAFDLLATVLLESGSAHRESVAKQVHQRIREELVSSSNNVTQLSNTLVRALRVMHSQLQLLSLDTMNYHLESLRSTMRQTDQAIEYARCKFAARSGISDDDSEERLAQKLPLTRGWLARGVVTLPTLSLAEAQNTWSTAQASSSFPVLMQTGRRMIANASESGERPVEAAVQFVQDGRTEAWRSAVRTSLVQIVTGSNNIPQEMSDASPETLTLDLGRLSEAKDLFDRMLIICTCVIISGQLATENSRLSPEAAGLTGRLQSMIEDERLTGQALATETLRSAGAELSDLEVTRVEALISKMLSRNSAGCKALMNGLGKVLSRELIIGRSSSSDLARSLKKFGATNLISSAESILEKLAAITSVTEAVHGPTYQKLLCGLL